MHAVLSLVAVGAGVSIVPESMKGFQSERIEYRPCGVPRLGLSYASWCAILHHRQKRSFSM